MRKLILLAVVVLMISSCGNNSNSKIKPEQARLMRIEQTRLDSIQQVKADNIAKVKAIQDSLEQIVNFEN